MSEEKTGAKQAAAYPLRMPSEMREKLQARADAAGRSLNHEIVEILKKSVGPPPEVPRGLHQIVEAATTGTGESIEEAAVRLVVQGIQFEPARRVAEARTAAERYRVVALQELLASTNERLGELLRYLATVRDMDADRLADVVRHREAVIRQMGQLDLTALRAGAHP
jgi:plasmid stability protein